MCGVLGGSSFVTIGSAGMGVGGSAPGIGRERIEELASLMMDVRASWGFDFGGEPAMTAPLAALA